MNSSPYQTYQNQTFDEYLDSIGDIWFIDIIYLYIFPFIGVCGTILNIINVWIFSHKEFKENLFFYIRVMSVLNLILTLFAIGYGICFSPRYLPKVNTYFTNIGQIIYISICK